MFKLFIFLIFIVAAQCQFFSSCNLGGDVVTPDNIVSPACPVGGNRCLVTRGQTLTADALFTPRFAHTELLTSATAHHTLLPGGMNVSKYFYELLKKIN